MIICHCSVVSDASVRRAVAEGAHSVAQVCRATGAGRGCGSCVFTVKRLLGEPVEVDTSSPLEVDGAAS